MRQIVRAQRALWHAHRQILSVRSAIRASRRYGRREPLRASLELVRAAGRLKKALNDVVHAYEDIRGQVEDVTTLIACTGAFLTIDKVMSEVAQAMADLRALTARPDFRLRIVRPPAFAAPLFDRDSRPADRIQTLLRRRRRRIPAAIEDAPRRISRGRAPPPASTCSL